MTEIKSHATAISVYGREVWVQCTCGWQTARSNNIFGRGVVRNLGRQHELNNNIGRTTEKQ